MPDHIVPVGPHGGSAELSGPPPVSRARQFREILGDLRRLDGVRGGLIVTPDGLVITADLPPSVAAEPLAALAATLGRELETGADELGRGRFRTAHFGAEDGVLFVGGSPVGFLILVADASARPEPVMQGLQDALARLAGAWRDAGAA
jgi:predicted regulator of Ras-like GTPase activity (Roadblock/LC7/MglB family)